MGANLELPPTGEPASLTGSPSAVARKAFKGGVALGGRQVLVVGLNVLGSTLLARLLSPADFGLYAIITLVLTFLVTFGDFGLGASLIRQIEEPAEDDYRSIFTAQQILVTILVAISWLVAPAIGRSYHLGAWDVWLLRLVTLSLFVTSFQVIPAIRLERHLNFHKLAVVETGAAFAFNVTAVGLAWKGFGATSFVIGLLARSATGAILANIIQPWRPAWAWDWHRVREHMRFGIPFQGQGIISLLKDSFSPVLIGLLMGAAQVGYVNWAGGLAVYPVTILGILGRIYLPAFSRMQSYPEALARFVEQALRVANALVAPAAVLMLAMAEPMTRIVFGQKWLVALPLFYVFWIPTVFAVTATPLTALLNALGRSRTTLGFSVLWMAGTWALGTPLVLILGPIGIAIASAVISSTGLVLNRIAQRHVPFKILRPIGPIWVWAAVVGLAAHFMQLRFPPAGIVSLVLQVGLWTGAYLLGLVFLYPGTARNALIWIRSEAWNPAFR